MISRRSSASATAMRGTRARPAPAATIPAIARMLPALRDSTRSPRRGMPSGWRLSYLAEAELGAGDVRAAIAAGNDALARTGRGGDHLHGPIMGVRVAAVYAQANRADLAAPLLERELADDAGGLAISPALLRIDPAWDAIRKDRRFVALLESHPAPAPQSAAAAMPTPTVAGLAFN